MENPNSSIQPVISAAIFGSGADSSALGCNLKGNLVHSPLSFQNILGGKKKKYPCSAICVIRRSCPLAGRFTFDLFKVAEQPATSGGGGVRARAGRVGLSVDRDERLRPNAALRLSVR